MDFFNDIFHNFALLEFYFLNMIYILLYIDFILSIFFQYSNILTRASHHWCLASNIVLVLFDIESNLEEYHMGLREIFSLCFPVWNSIVPYVFKFFLIHLTWKLHFFSNIFVVYRSILHDINKKKCLILTEIMPKPALKILIWISKLWL